MAAEDQRRVRPPTVSLLTCLHSGGAGVAGMVVQRCQPGQAKLPFLNDGDYTRPPSHGAHHTRPPNQVTFLGQDALRALSLGHITVFPKRHQQA